MLKLYSYSGIDGIEPIEHTLEQARTQLFRRRGGGGVHFKLERTSCQQSLKYISLYNTGGATFSTKKRNIFLCT